jgi:flavin reductase (DIM6/NTAB) family NADH-FMN oxidoreductase RutF
MEAVVTETRTGVGDLPLESQFREVMAGVATPVSIVTAMNGQTPHGTTVSAFASLSMTPPMVVVSLARGSFLLALMQETNSFGVNVLGLDQSPLAVRFAGKDVDRFRDVDWHADHGLPRLPGSPGWLACRLSGVFDGGDHVLALGQVVAAETFEAQPLTYHGRLYGTHARLE